MNTRQRCMNILHYKEADRMPAVHFGYWNECLYEWVDQGHISRDVALAARRDGSAGQRELDKIIGWDCNWYTTVQTKNGLFPRFEHTVLEVLPDGSQRVQTGNGVIEKIKPGVVSIPSEDDYLLKDREAFETLFKPKMQYSPERVNTEFVTVLDDHTIKMRVWERGSGETWACGTGACAAAVAAVENGFCKKGEDIKVKLMGGDLIINYTDETVYMTGEAETVFEGEVVV